MPTPCATPEAIAAGCVVDCLNPFNWVEIKKGPKGPIQHTKHSLNQKINRQVKSADELDAVKNPLKKTEVKYDSQGRPSEKFIGEKATVAVNPETGKVVTVHPTGSKLAERLKRQQGGGQ
jgi:hypothetical protein